MTRPLSVDGLTLCHRHNLPGLQLATSCDGILREAAFGVADRATERDLHVSTPMRAGSITKLVTAALAVLLETEGHAALDTSLADRAPDLEPVSPFSGPPVTLRHLLAHSSGLPRGPYSRRRVDTEARLRRLPGLPLVFAPGRRRKYSNLGFALAGTVLAREAGSPFSALARTRVLEPLALARSALLEPSQDGPESIARGHRAGHYRSLIHRQQRLRAAPPSSALAPAGGLVTTAGDIVRLVEGLARNTLAPDHWNPLATVQPPGPPAPAWGLGMRPGHRLGRPCWWHDGGDSGFSGLWVAFPEDGVFGAALTNRCSAGHALEVALAAALAPCFAMPAPRPPRVRVERYVGRYRDGRGTVEIVQRGSTLVLRDRGTSTRLEPRGRHRFASSEGPSRDHLLRFAVDRDHAWSFRFGERELHRDLPLAAIAMDGGTALDLPDAPTLERLGAWPGVYHRPGFGDVHVFLRPEGLTISSYYAEEVALRPTPDRRPREEGAPATDRFLVEGGWLDGEPAAFRTRHGNTLLDLAHMRFRRR